MEESNLFLLSLLKSGLWDTPVDLNSDWIAADWGVIEKIATAQTVIGIMMDGIVKLPDELRPDKKLFFKLLLKVKDIEQKNENLNKVTPQIIKYLNNNGCGVVLLKGQGLAVYYTHPTHRMSGDIDIFTGFDDDAYRKANDIIKSLATHVGYDNGERKHVDCTVMNEVVELHGSIKCTISNKCDKNIEEWAHQRLTCNNVIIENEYGKLITPPINFNALYVFVHFLNHYMNGGIGLRHVIDWMMFLNCNYDKIDMKLLEQDVERLGLRKFWAMFASVAVFYLGCPKDKMPMYNCNYDGRCKPVLRHIFKTGNFGVRQKKYQLSGDNNKTLKKITTFVGQIPVYLDNWSIFQRETMHCFVQFVKDGVNDI